MKRAQLVGRVTELGDEDAVVEVQEDEESCLSAFSCSCCSTFCPQPRTLRVERGELEVGDEVRVTLPRFSGYLSAFIVFVLPIAFAVAGMIIGGRFRDASGGAELPTILGGVAGFALALLIALGVNRLLSDPGRYEVKRLKTAGPEPSPQQGGSPREPA